MAAGVALAWEGRGCAPTVLDGHGTVGIVRGGLRWPLVGKRRVLTYLVPQRMPGMREARRAGAYIAHPAGGRVPDEPALRTRPCGADQNRPTPYFIAITPHPIRPPAFPVGWPPSSFFA